MISAISTCCDLVYQVSRVSGTSSLRWWSNLKAKEAVEKQEAAAKAEAAAAGHTAQLQQEMELLMLASMQAL